MTSRSWFLIAALGVLTVEAACSGAAPSKPSPLLVCTAGEDNCPEEKEQSSVTKGSGPTETPHQLEATNQSSSSTPDAGSDAGHALGPSCRDLKACCEKLDEAGYVTTFCYGALAVGQEDICGTKLKSYYDDPEGTPCTPPANP